MTSTASLTAPSKTPAARRSSESALRATATLAGAHGRWTSLEVLTSLPPAPASWPALSALRVSECPASYGRKPTNHEALITISALVTCLHRPEIALVPSQQGIAVCWPNLEWLFALLDRYRMVAVRDDAPKLRVQPLRLPPRSLIARGRGSLESIGARRRPFAPGLSSASLASAGSGVSP